jgi:hypothetical protein
MAEMIQPEGEISSSPLAEFMRTENEQESKSVKTTFLEPYTGILAGENFDGDLG